MYPDLVLLSEGRRTLVGYSKSSDIELLTDTLLSPILLVWSFASAR